MLRLFVFALCLVGLFSNVQCREEKGSSTLGSSPTGSLVETIRFANAFPDPPIVYGWARRTRTERYTVEIIKVERDSFDASITINGANSFGSNVRFYWSAQEFVKDEHTLLGEYEYHGDITMGQPTDMFAPVITETSSNVYDVFGRDVYTSQLYTILQEKIPFPIYQTTDINQPIEVHVRCDTFYIDGSVEPFYGIIRATIHARKIVSDKQTFDFRSAQRCSSEFGCAEPPQASTDINGKSNVAPIPGTDLDIFAYDFTGNLYLSLEGSNSTTPQEGGNGMNGANGFDGTHPNCDHECNNDCGGLFDDDWFLTGNPGSDGQNGRDGDQGGGVVQNGGDAGNILLYTQHFSGFVTLDKHPGSAGHPAAHGYGGKGGIGGTGSCGCSCNVYLRCYVLVICIPTCKVKDDNWCQTSGANGKNGADGADGFQVFDIPSVGRQGSIGSTDLATVDSVKQWFIDDAELLRMIEREGEMLFQRNNNLDAKPIFDFILDVANETSLIYKQASELSEYIDQGYDYYGNPEIYAPDRDWTDLDARTQELLATGQSIEDAYNNVFMEMQDDLQSITTISAVVNGAIEANDEMFAFEEKELKEKKQLYLKALKKIEATMYAEMVAIRAYSQVVHYVEEIKDQVKFLSNLLGGIVGCAVGILSGNPKDAFSSSKSLIRGMKEKDCELPTIEDMEESLESNLEFAFDYQATKPENFDYSTMDASAVPVIMLSDLAKNKAELLQELRCLFQDPNSELALTLQRLIDNYFRDGAFRVILIAQLMNMDAKLKQIGYNRQVLAEVQASTNEALDAAENSVPMNAKSSFTDLLLNMFQLQENLIMESIYELSKAYEFESLWDFDALGKFAVSFSDKNVVSNVGSLNGMVQLNLIYQDLQTQRATFLDFTSIYAGPASHIFTGYWEFNQETASSVISELQTNGQTTITLDIDPNDPATTRCSNCYNGRLVGFYIEIIGDPQAQDVPSTTYVMVSHQGDSRFMETLPGGNNSVANYQQTPESDTSGKLMSFESSQLMSSIDDPALQIKFMNPEYQYCNGDGTDFSGSKPCKSPYATYLITLPKSDSYVCPTNPNDAISGLNCQDFDFSKLKEIRLYAKVNSWSNYPSDPHAASRQIAEYQTTH